MSPICCSIYSPFEATKATSGQELQLLGKNLDKMNCKTEGPKLELKLNLSPPRDHRQVLSPHGSVSSTEISPRSSCVSREVSPDGPETGTMMLVGCPRCLMYVMLSEEDPKCPKCKSTVLLDFLHEDRIRGLKK